MQVSDTYSADVWRCLHEVGFVIAGSGGMASSTCILPAASEI